VGLPVAVAVAAPEPVGPAVGLPPDALAAGVPAADGLSSPLHALRARSAAATAVVAAARLSVLTHMDKPPMA
jgi:hypothetical protein